MAAKPVGMWQHKYGTRSLRHFCIQLLCLQEFLDMPSQSKATRKLSSWVLHGFAFLPFQGFGLFFSICPEQMAASKKIHVFKNCAGKVPKASAAYSLQPPKREVRMQLLQHPAASSLVSSTQAREKDNLLDDLDVPFGSFWCHHA